MAVGERSPWVSSVAKESVDDKSSRRVASMSLVGEQSPAGVVGVVMPSRYVVRIRPYQTSFPLSLGRDEGRASIVDAHASVEHGATAALPR